MEGTIVHFLPMLLYLLDSMYARCAYSKAGCGCPFSIVFSILTIVSLYYPALWVPYRQSIIHCLSRPVIATDVYDCHTLYGHRIHTLFCQGIDIQSIYVHWYYHGHCALCMCDIHRTHLALSAGHAALLFAEHTDYTARQLYIDGSVICCRLWCWDRSETLVHSRTYGCSLYSHSRMAMQAQDIAVMDGSDPWCHQSLCVVVHNDWWDSYRIQCERIRSIA